MTSATPRRQRRWPRRLLLAAVALALLGWLLLLSGTPSVPARDRPLPADVAAGRAAVAQLKTAQAMPGAAVRIDAAMLNGLAALASDASGLRHVAAHLDKGTLVGRASLSLPLGQWLNVEARITGAHQGFPPIDARIGLVPVPRFLSRWAAEAGHWLLRRRGARLPELDAMVRRIAVGPDAVTAALALPSGTRLVDSALRSTGATLDDARTAKMLCRLVAAHRTAPAAELHIHVRRAFATGGGTPDANRAAFAALALLVAPERATQIFAPAAERAAACGAGPGMFAPDTTLHGRPDLAKHWALSAALGAVIGDDAGTALGEWKELADSDGGSGFSFVDLAADRAGLRAARAAIDPERAAASAATLARADAEALLPARLTGGPEGLTEAQFRARFGSLDADRYTDAVALIDRELARR